MRHAAVSCQKQQQQVVEVIKATNANSPCSEPVNLTVAQQNKGIDVVLGSFRAFKKYDHKSTQFSQLGEYFGDMITNQRGSRGRQPHGHRVKNSN